MRITLHTVRGTFEGSQLVATEKDAAKIKDLIQKCVHAGEYFTLNVESGYMVFGPEVLRSAVVVVEN